MSDAKDAAKRTYKLEVHLIDETPEKSEPNFFKRVAEILGVGALVGALVVSLGWSYAFAWFLNWKIPFHPLKLRIEDILEYGRLAISSSYLGIVLTAILLGLCFIFLKFKVFARLGPLVFVLIAVTLWMAAHWFGTWTARRDFEAHVNEGFENLPMVEITFAKDVVVPDFFLQDVSPGQACYRLVFSAENAIWIARTEHGDRDPPIAMVPLDSLVLLRLYPTQANC